MVSEEIKHIKMIHPVLVFDFTNSVAVMRCWPVLWIKHQKCFMNLTMHFSAKIKLRDIFLFPAAPELSKLSLSKTITKVNQFDSSLSCQEDVVSFDVTMDNSVAVQMLKTLLSQRTENTRCSAWITNPLFSSCVLYIHLNMVHLKGYAEQSM